MLLLSTRSGLSTSATRSATFTLVLAWAQCWRFFSFWCWWSWFWWFCLFFLHCRYLRFLFFHLSFQFGCGGSYFCHLFLLLSYLFFILDILSLEFANLFVLCNPM